MKKKVGILVLAILLLLIFFVGGTVYWLFSKAKNISHSALNISGNTTSAPTEAPSGSVDLPESDVAGQDFANIPRYAGSIRTNYYISDDQKFISVEYVAATNASTVIDYYKQYLQNQNWTFNSSDKKTYAFTSEGYDLTIDIVGENTTPALVEYSLNLTKVSY